MIYLKRMLKLFLVGFIIMSNIIVSAQDCEEILTVILINHQGGFFIDKDIVISEIGGTRTFKEKSNSKGEAIFNLPCNTEFYINISNYSKTQKYKTGNKTVKCKQTFTYNPDNIAKANAFKMSKAEKEKVNKIANSLPNFIKVKNSYMEKPKLFKYFSEINITIKDINNHPLIKEEIWIIGEKRKKTIYAKTNKYGKIKVYLPKGDRYSINFKYSKNYSYINVKYTKGTSKSKLKYSYLGTKEIERRKKEIEKRIAEKEKREKEKEKRFVWYCKKLGISLEEGRKLKVEEFLSEANPFSDTVISAVLNRNKWNDKLIVCDFTGSMQSYSIQLYAWYKLHYMNEKNLQFVFFNDGDNKDDKDKKNGETGGIYYSPSKGVDSLFSFGSMVSSKGYGGANPENNIEALIKGTKMAKPFKELVMIVDNYSMVSDIELLPKFNIPVHIILCGIKNEILSDYLLIAWKTKGSIHTIEEDVTKIAKMSNGQDITINGVKYRIMGGEFVRISDI